MTDKPRQVLCDLIAKYGHSLADDRSRCSGLLRDLCGSHKAEIAVLLDAQEEGVPAALRASIPSGSAEMLIGRLSKSLEKDRHLTAESALWAVETWALALGVISTTERPLPEDESEPTSNEQPEPLPPPAKKSTNWVILMTAIVILAVVKTYKHHEDEQVRHAIELAKGRSSEQIRRKIEQTQREAEAERQRQAEALAQQQREKELEQASATDSSGSGEKSFVISANWGSQIQAYASQQKCPNAEFSEQGYPYTLFVTIPASRIKDPSEAWKVYEDRAVTVVGCWFSKDDGLAHTKMRRKKDGRTWEEDLNFSDGSWNRIE